MVLLEVIGELQDMRQIHPSVQNGRLTNDELERFYCSLLYSQTGSYKDSAKRLGNDWRTVEKKVDKELAKQLSNELREV